MTLRHASPSKKGIVAFEAVMWITRILIMVFVMLSIMFVTSSFIVKNIDTRLPESYVLLNVAYYSGKGLAPVDSETGRVYPGVVNLGGKEFNQNFNYGEGTDEPVFIAARVASLFSGKVHELFYNENAFKDWNFLYRAGLVEGVGGVKKVSILKNMGVEEGGNRNTAEATLEAATKNE